MFQYIYFHLSLKNIEFFIISMKQKEIFQRHPYVIHGVQNKNFTPQRLFENLFFN